MEHTRNKLVKVNINSITLPEVIIKDRDFSEFERLKKCLEKRGQIKNIVLCETSTGFEVLDGAKIIVALKELGHKTVIGFNLGVLTENEKNQVRLEIFRDYFQTNYVNIGLMLKKMTETGELSKICNYIPFDVSQATHLIKMTEFDWEEFSQNKNLEGQVDLFGFLEEDNEEPKVDTQEVLIKNEEGVFEEISLPITDIESDVLTNEETFPVEETENEEKEIEWDIPKVETLEEKPTEPIEVKNEEIELKQNDDLNFKVEDIGYFKTAKGDIKIQISNITDKWVIFKELASGKRKDCLLPLFKDKFTKMVIPVSNQDEEFELDTEDFYYDGENKKLIIKKNLGPNFDLIKEICRETAINEYAFYQGKIKEEFYEYQSLGETLEVTRCKLIDFFDVPRFVTMKIIVNKLKN